MAKKVKIKIPKSVLELRLSPKKYAKKHDIRLSGKHMSKKDRKQAQKHLEKEYAEFASSGLNKAVRILAENNVESKKIMKVSDGVENIIYNPDIMKRIAKIYKKHPEEYPNMIYLPNIIMNTLVYLKSDNATEEDKKIAEIIDPEQLVSFCEKILKKQIKRYKNLGLSDEKAFQLATAVPTTKQFKVNRGWYRKLIVSMYDMASNEEVEVEQTIKSVLKVDKKKYIKKSDFKEGFYSTFILQKSSNNVKNFTDTQKELHEELIEKTLHYLDDIPKKKCREILKNYIKIRKKAESLKQDKKRVIKFIDHANSNSPYINIKTVVQDLVAADPNNELYLS